MLNQTITDFLKANQGDSPEGESIEFPDGKYSDEFGNLGLGERDDAIRARFLSHLKFILKLNAVQEYTLTPDKLIEYALKLTEISVSDENAIGGIYEDALQNIAEALHNLSQKLEVEIDESDF
ncbi:MAG: hypothetical protein KME32_34200 [Mojavia pulchra JT2-VF2]|uniref:Uncharacterized protein n=1 Tax=Mojavia pulchra JT2-VF2 TaxID=287848 RepID=A0A951UK73_9NOST|nr:hypothetical protein [Mojavia pulchra JT2-VF2]